MVQVLFFFHLLCHQLLHPPKSNGSQSSSQPSLLAVWTSRYIVKAIRPLLFLCCFIDIEVPQRFREGICLCFFVYPSSSSQTFRLAVAIIGFHLLNYLQLFPFACCSCVSPPLSLPSTVCPPRFFRWRWSTKSYSDRNDDRDVSENDDKTIGERQPSSTHPLPACRSPCMRLVLLLFPTLLELSPLHLLG